MVACADLRRETAKACVAEYGCRAMSMDELAALEIRIVINLTLAPLLLTLPAHAAIERARDAHLPTSGSPAWTEAAEQP